MALLYPWATKEYLLWEMTIGQLIMYHNAGIQIKYPKPDDEDDKGFASMGDDDRQAAIEAARTAMADKYGDV